MIRPCLSCREPNMVHPILSQPLDHTMSVEQQAGSLEIVMDTERLITGAWVGEGSPIVAGMVEGALWSKLWHALSAS